jgi:hypothetical protein
VIQGLNAAIKNMWGAIVAVEKNLDLSVNMVLSRYALMRAQQAKVGLMVVTYVILQFMDTLVMILLGFLTVGVCVT